MGRKHLQLVIGGCVVAAVVCLCFVFYSNYASRSSFGSSSISDDSYKPMVSYGGFLYIYKTEQRDLPEQAKRVGEVDISLGTCRRKPGHDHPEKYVSNCYSVGRPLYMDGGSLYVEFPEGITVMELEEDTD